MTTELVLVAHGTERPAARAAVGGLVADVRAALPEVRVRLAHVDVQSPTLVGVMATVRAAGARAVVVPLLLAAGYHVEVDIAAAVDPGLDVVTPTFADHPALVDIALSRIELGDLDALVVAAAGSSRVGAREQVQRFAVEVGRATGRPVTVGWAASGSPTVAEAVGTALAGAGGVGRVGVVTYLLAPGVFAARVHTAALDAGAVAVGSPLAPDPRLAGIVVERYRAAIDTALPPGAGLRR